jgi:predicted NAD/FAD-dependent oxidoreductase
VPQTLDLLATGKVPLPYPVRDILEGMDYAPCLTLLVQLAGPSQIPEPGGIWMNGEPLLWMADNQRKGIASDGGALVTIHAGQDYSRDNLETPEAHVTATMLAAAASWLGSAVEHAQLHRWRYSIPLRVHPEPCLLVAEPAPLAFAGDAFGGPRVEAAALSGLAAADRLAQLLGRG